MPLLYLETYVLQFEIIICWIDCLLGIIMSAIMSTARFT